MCTHCQVAGWLMEFRPVLNRHGVDVASHAMWLMNNDGNVLRIEPQRRHVAEKHRRRWAHCRIADIHKKATRGWSYTVDVDENVSPAQIIL